MGRKKKKVVITRYRYANILPINPRGKEMRLEDRKYIKEYILDKLKGDWILLMGDIETIAVIEKIVYTPDTDASDDLAMIMGVDTNVYLAKKRDLLKKKIAEWGNINEDTYNKLVMINFISSGDGVIWDYAIKKESDNEKEVNEFYDGFIEDLVTNILGMKEDGKVEPGK